MRECDDLVNKVKNQLSPLEHLANPRFAQRRGDEIQGAHPTHGGTDHADKNSTNFSVDVKKQVWYCHAHKTGGDILHWIAVDEGIVNCNDANNIHDVFTEVLRAAADRAGVDLSQADGADMAELAKKKEEREKLQKAYNIAQDYFKSNLTEEHKEWINKNYGFDEDTIERFGIGFSPDDDGLKKKLESEMGQYAYSTGLLVRMGGEYKDFFRGRIVFPYNYRDEPGYFIARKTPWTADDGLKKAKYIKQLVGESKDYVSDQVSNHIYGLDHIRGEDEIVVTEGITDAISVLDYGFPCISPITTRFKQEDIDKLKKYTHNKKIYVCNDADEAGFSGAMKTLEEIPNSHLVELEEGDLNDFYMSNGPDEFQALVDEAIPRAEALAKYKDDIEYLFLPALKDIAQDPEKVRSVWSPKDQEYKHRSLSQILSGVNDIKEAVSIFKRTKKSHERAPTGIEKSLRKEVITGVIRRHLQKKGKFLYDSDMEDVYFFNEKTHEVFNVKSKKFVSKIENDYAVSETTDMGDYLFQQIYNRGVLDGDEVDIQRLFYYDETENKMYIHNRNDHYYVLDGENIYREPNGKNVFFKTKNTNHESVFEYIEPEDREWPEEVIGQIDEWADEGNMLHQVLVNRTNFAPKTALSARQQRLQQLITIYMFPFGSRFPAKPITAYIGQKGSGKSITMEMMGKFLIGKDYDVAGLPSEKDFMVVAYNNPLYFIDNLDKQKRWVNDALASIATGVSIKERKLYTNFESAEAKIDCFLGVNSRTPEFNRDDVVDRLLIFYVDRLKKNIDPNVLMNPIENYWDELWSLYMDDLNRIVETFKDFDAESVRSEHRLVGWVVFARAVAEAMGLDEDKVEELITDMKYEKYAFALQDDPILPAIRKAEKIGKIDEEKWYSAKGLHNLLCEVHDQYDDEKSSSRSLAKKLPNYLQELSELVGMRRRQNKNKHRYEYAFSEEAPEDASEDDSQSSLTTLDESSSDGAPTILHVVKEILNKSDEPLSLMEMEKPAEEEHDIGFEKVEKEVKKMKKNGDVYITDVDEYGNKLYQLS